MEVKKRKSPHLPKGVLIALCVCFALVVSFVSCCWVADSHDYRESRNLNGSHMHKREYKRVLQVKELDYNAFLARYGEPDCTRVRPSNGYHPDHYTAYYPGISMTYVWVERSRAQNPRFVPRLVLLTISDDSYRFGKQKIGVGSTREEVAAAYANSRPIEPDELAHSTWDFPDVDEGWYGDYWCRILFRYDEDGRVEAMAYEPSAFW